MSHLTDHPRIALIAALCAAGAACEAAPRERGSWERFAVAEPLSRLSRGCRAVSKSLRTPGAARLQPGDYGFTIVSTIGPTAGDSVRGRLVLRPTRFTDRSPRTGQGPRPDENRGAKPLYGFLLDADLAHIGAPLPDGTRADEPLPSSTDPIFPGFLAHVQNWGGAEASSQNVLTAGTSINARVDLGYGVADGQGIFLMVRTLDASGFGGTWQQGGLLAAGGYFCAERVVP